VLAGAHHEDDHGHDKKRGRQHDPTLVNVFIQVQPGQGNGYADAGNERQGQGGIDQLAEVGALDLVQIGERDAYNEGSFDALPKSDNESLEQGIS